jgi:hypothetical protein
MGTAIDMRLTLAVRVGPGTTYGRHAGGCAGTSMTRTPSSWPQSIHPTLTPPAAPKPSGGGRDRPLSGVQICLNWTLPRSRRHGRVGDGKGKSGIEESRRWMACAVGCLRGRRSRDTRPRQKWKQAKRYRHPPPRTAEHDPG